MNPSNRHNLLSRYFLALFPLSIFLYAEPASSRFATTKNPAAAKNPAATSDKNGSRNHKHFRLSVDQSFVVIIVASLLLTLVTLLIQPVAFSDLWRITLENNGLNFLLNWLPILFFMAVLYFIGLGTVPSIMMASAVFVAMSVTNRFMISFRNDPLMPWDLQLGGELAGVLEAFDAQFMLTLIGAIFAFVVVAVILSLVVRSERLELSLRMIMLALCLMAALFINISTYHDSDLNLGMHVSGSFLNAVDRNNSKGYLYSFIYYLNTVRLTEPEDYDPELIQEMIAAADTSGIERAKEGNRPHIVMVMGEAFSDISLSPHFDFTDSVDPLENYQAILEDSISGDIFVQGFGGWTVQAEFDVLTGLNARHFRATPYAFRLINSEFDSLASILSRVGYQNAFLHPGHPWFYNRHNVYAHLGFEELVFDEAFEQVSTPGGFVGEEDTISYLLQMFDDSIESHPDSPYFNFCVTIQNHGPYRDKYDNVAVPNFASDLNLSETEMNDLSNFFHGLKDADAGIGQMVEHFSASPEPVVLVYFSDHQPMLSQAMYDQVFPLSQNPEAIEELTRLHSVPFFIWFNDAALELYELEHISELTDDEDLFMSASYLGAYVLELLELENISPLMDFNMDLRRRFPIVHQYKSFDSLGRPSDSLPKSDLLPLKIYEDWSYYKMLHHD